MNRAQLEAKYLLERLSFDPLTGIFVWLKRPPGSIKKDGSLRSWNSRYSGTQAFANVGNHGYRYGRIDGIQFTAHRVAWAMHYGSWPKGEIDHINGDRTDNRIANLRDVTPSENRKNSAMHARNSSGITGVSWHAKYKKWQAQIKANGKNLHLGFFSSFDEAAAVRKDASQKYGYHPNHGRSAGHVRAA